MPKFRDWIASRSAATLASSDELYVRDASGDVSQHTTYGALTAVADAHIADTTDAHDASAVSITDAAGNYTATDVEGALAELPSQYAPADVDQFVDPFPTWFGGGTVNEAISDIVTHMDAYVGAGSGTPNGVVVGNVGDRYIDTAATLGARVWYKASGTATNTGWLVAEGDTGWRAITEWDSAGTITGEALGTGWVPRTSVAGGVYRRRVGSTCFLHVANIQASTLNPSGYMVAIHAGFGSGLGGRFSTHVILTSAGTSTMTIEGSGRANALIASGATINGALVSYSSIEGWPTSLPGSAD